MDKAKEYMVQKAFGEESGCENELRRYITWPAQVSLQFIQT